MKKQAIQRYCEWHGSYNIRCKNVAKWHAYHKDYCDIHKKAEDRQHKLARLPKIVWERITRPQFAKLLPPRGIIEENPFIEKPEWIWCKPEQKRAAKEILNAAWFDSVVLAEFACDGCLESRYIPTMFLTHGEELVYPENFSELEKMLLDRKPPPFDSMHVAAYYSSKTHQTPDGYHYCGHFHLTRLWKPWEDPKRYLNQERSDDEIKTGRRLAKSRRVARQATKR